MVTAITHRLVLWLAVAAAVLTGSLLGELSDLGEVPNVSATHRTYFDFTPPTLAAGQPAMLTTGWHGTGNRGLDWDDQNRNSNTVYVHGYAYSPNTPTATIRGHIHIAAHNGFYCQTTKGTVTRYTNSGTRGVYYWVHTTPLYPGRQPLWFTNANGIGNWNRWTAARTVTSEPNSNCGFTGSHVHETRDTNSWWYGDNTNNFPTGNYCTLYPTSNCNTYQNNNQANWTRAVIIRNW